jgi:hypothetical protein
MIGAFIAYAVALGVGLGIVSAAVFLMALAVGCLFWATKKFKEMMY